MSKPPISLTVSAASKEATVSAGRKPAKNISAAKLESLAVAAVSGFDGCLGIDTLDRVKTELSVLATALRNDDMPLDRHDAADVISQIATRIEVALELAIGATSEAAE